MTAVTRMTRDQDVGAVLVTEGEWSHRPAGTWQTSTERSVRHDDS
ncbi:hypothetical protein ACFYY3_15335 [Streptomyces sp. NPDC001812]|uniref:Uncharacterized protein n=1 Tax=Streptomyces cathayae TaxID=3031124 RepID=A0ABY8K294_9ACTN|nr:hypothetical protein [Streptomyces sp. HUAS 5]WGD41793.1 hypothetical protein PYS65_17420 [Streptomyces sp. HUAS 5]